MIIELSTHLLPIVVPDTYGSGLQYEIHDDCWEDLKQAMTDIAKEYIEEALEETDLGKVDIIMTGFNSPREYNYITDSCTFTLNVPDDYTQHIEGNMTEDFFKWIKEQYCSRSGFISFYPYERENYLKALHEPNSIYSKKDMAIAMWLMYQLKDYPDKQNEYFDDVWEKCCENGWKIDEEDEYDDYN